MKYIFLFIVIVIFYTSIHNNILYSYQEPGDTPFDRHNENLKSQIDKGTNIKNISQSKNLFGLTYAWINFVLGLLGIMTLIYIIFYAYKAIIFSYDENVLKKVYKILFYLIIGFIIILFSYLIVKFFVS